MKPLLTQMGEALIKRDALLLRALALEWMRHKDDNAVWAMPETDDQGTMIAAAALAELFAARLRVAAPEWTHHVGAFSEPFYALESAYRLRSVRECCEQEAPVCLRRRGIYAPSNFLTSA